jgi:hypothetical protein
MQFQFDVTGLPPTTSVEPPAPPADVVQTTDLLKQILEVQREQTVLLQHLLAAHDGLGRWRLFLHRWRDEYPDLSPECKEILPTLERAYAQLVSELTDSLRNNGPQPLDNDFALQEFLDRYGMRLAQLGTLLNVIAPLAEAGPPPSEAT